MNGQIGLNMFSLREHCKTEDDLEETLKKLKKIGYRSLQVSGTPLAPAIVRKALDRHGFRCCATHESLAMIRDTAKLTEKLHTLQCDFAALGCAPEEYRCSEEGWKTFFPILAEAGKALAAAGIQLGYHNHDLEFSHLSDGRTVLAALCEAIPANDLAVELDTHWVARGGGDVAGWIRRMTGRIPVCHLKDCVMLREDKWARPVFCEVGQGNLDWESILDACQDAGVREYVVEQDSPFPGRDIFDSVALSFDYLRKMGVQA